MRQGFNLKPEFIPMFKAFMSNNSDVPEDLQMHIEYVNVNVEFEDQGTAESLRLIKDRLKPNRHVLIVSCDLITDIDLSELCVRQRVSDALMTILLAPLPPQLTECAMPGEFLPSFCSLRSDSQPFELVSCYNCWPRESYST